MATNETFRRETISPKNRRASLCPAKNMNGLNTRAIPCDGLTRSLGSFITCDLWQPIRKRGHIAQSRLTFGVHIFALQPQDCDLWHFASSLSREDVPFYSPSRTIDISLLKSLFFSRRATNIGKCTIDHNSISRGIDRKWLKKTVNSWKPQKMLYL